MDNKSTLVSPHYILNFIPDARFTQLSEQYAIDYEVKILTGQLMFILLILSILRKRWDIEVFFKFLKQDLSFSHFISTSVNGIKVMLYMTLIVALLVKIYSLINKMGLRVSKLAIMNDTIRYHQQQINSLQQEIKHLKKELQECSLSSDY